jgi:hypothetical protein
MAHIAVADVRIRPPRVPVAEAIPRGPPMEEESEVQGWRRVTAPIRLETTSNGHRRKRIEQNPCRMLPEPSLADRGGQCKF